MSAAVVALPYCPHCPHVLVMDDEPMILELLQELLEEEGYRVTPSPTLLAPQTISALAPDVILQDLHLGGSPEPAAAFLERLQHGSAIAAIPHILCTGDHRVVHDTELATQLALLGVQVVRKPFAIEEVLTALAAARG